jgi:TonB-dependent receptor
MHPAFAPLAHRFAQPLSKRFGIRPLHVRGTRAAVPFIALRVGPVADWQTNQFKTQHNGNRTDIRLTRGPASISLLDTKKPEGGCMSSRFQFRAQAGSLSLALAAMLVCNAQAQDVPAELMDELIVRGQRLAQERAIESRRNSEAFVDAVSADDIGRLADKNAAEALDRIAGISVTIDQGEGRFVSIRGVNPALNNLTINGVSAGSPEADGGGRQVPLDVIGAELLRSIEVIKVQTPEMDAQGVGGTVNVVTKGPFDYEQSQFMFGSMQVGYDDLNSETPYAADAIVGGTNDSRTLGWLLGSAYSYRDSAAHGVYQDDWREVELDGVAASIPENAKNNIYSLERKRLGANAALEWRPTDSTKYFLRAFYSKYDEDEVRQRYEHFFSRDITQLTANSGVSGTNNRREQDLRLEQKDKRFFNVAIGGETVLANRWMLDYALQANDNQQIEPNRNWEWRGDDYGPDSWAIDADGIVHVTSGPVDVLDPTRLNFLRLRTQDNDTDEEGRIAKLNLKREIGHNESYLKAGVKLTTTERRNDSSQVTYRAGSSDWNLSQFDHFDRVVTNTIDGKRYPNMIVNPGAANDFYAANANNPEYFALDEEDTFEAEYQGDYEVDEDVLAGYVMGRWNVGRWQFISGARIEQTEVSSAGFERNPETGAARRVTGEGEYTNVLPALIARLELTDAWVLRGAWTNTLGRPNYEQIAPISELSVDGAIGSLSIGNPELEARQSENYDLALEWYFARGGLLTLAGFHKKIEDEIVTRIQTLDDHTYNGTTYEQFEITSYENATSAELTGAELSYQQQFDWLPSPWDGLGIAMSYATIDGESEVQGREDLPLVRQPEWTRSATLFYQKNGFQLALALSESDEFLSDVSDEPETDLYSGEYGRLDLRGSYSFLEKYSVFLEWLNINDEPTTEFQGGREHQNTQFEEYGQTWYVGLTAGF